MIYKVDYNDLQGGLQGGLQSITINYNLITRWFTMIDNQLKSITLWLMTNYNMVYNELQGNLQ